MGTLDISGSARYGDGSGNSGIPTQNVTGQADSSMHLVGRTIIAQKGTNSAQLDISGGINVVGPSKLTDLSGAYIDISGGNIDIDSSAAPGGDIRIITNTGTDQKIVIDNKQGAASDSVSIKSEAGGIDIIAFTTVDINGSGALALNGGNVTINGSGDLVLNGDDVTINGSGGALGSGDLALNGVDVTINGSGVLACCASSDVLVDAAAGQDVNIAGGQVALVSKDDAASAISLTTNVGSTETITVTNTQGTDEAAITLAATAGGVDIDAAIGKDVDISGGQVLLGNKDNVVGAISLTTNVGSTETIVVTNTQGTSDNAITLKAALGGVNIDAYGNSNFTTSTGTLNLTANIQDVAIEAVVGNVDILALNGIAKLTGTGVAITSTTNNVVITGAANVDISAANVDINAGTSVKLSDGSGAYIDMSGNKIDISGDDVTINGSGTLNVTGATTLTGLLNANGGIICDTDKFVVADGTGDVTCGDISCNGITILDGGITLDGNASISGYSGDIFGTTVTNNDNCGRIDISGSITGGNTAFFTFQNNKITTNSIILTTLNVANGSGNNAVLQLAALQQTVSGSCRLGIYNPAGSSATILADTGVKVHFLIINPTS